MPLFSCVATRVRRNWSLVTTPVELPTRDGLVALLLLFLVECLPSPEGFLEAL